MYVDSLRGFRFDISKHLKVTDLREAVEGSMHIEAPTLSAQKLTPLVREGISVWSWSKADNNKLLLRYVFTTWPMILDLQPVTTRNGHILPIILCICDNYDKVIQNYTQKTWKEKASQVSHSGFMRWKWVGNPS